MRPVLRGICRRLRPANGVPLDIGPHAVFDVVIRRTADPAARGAMTAVLAALRLLDTSGDWKPVSAATLHTARALAAGDPVRPALIRFVEGLAAYEESDWGDGGYSELVEPLFAIADAFERRGARLLAADLYWTIEGHGSNWVHHDRALAARKRIEAGYTKTIARR